MTTTHPPTDQTSTGRDSDLPRLPNDVRTSLVLSLLFTGAIFGFFYAWVCSTMWGLDDADPRVAIGAMQAMNASVRNAVFFPAFFLTPIVVAVAGVQLRRVGRITSANRFFAAAGLYLVGGLLLTMIINVPMNEELAQVAIPASLEDAATIWQDYSGRWQLANIARTAASAASLALIGTGLTSLDRR